MSDITMCATASCPKRRDCYRFQAAPGPWQSYANFNIKTDACFAKIRRGMKTRRNYGRKATFQG